MVIAIAVRGLKGKLRAAAPLVQDIRACADAKVPAASSALYHRTITTSGKASNVAVETAGTTPTASTSAATLNVSAATNAGASLESSRATPRRLIESKPEALSLLRSQPQHYVVASMVGKTMLLHERDLVTLPRLTDVEVGDVIELDRIHEVGSRDYTLRAQDPISTRKRGLDALARRSVPTSIVPAHAQQLLDRLDRPLEHDLVESDSWAASLRPGGLAHIGAVLNKDTVRVRCTIVEHTKGAAEIVHKKKRRKGYERHLLRKNKYTRLRVDGIRVGDGTGGH